MTRADCQEISWVQSTIFIEFFTTAKPLEVLLDRSNKPDYYLKVKSDHVQEALPRHTWESTWAKWLDEPGTPPIKLDPYSGRMGSISPSATPFPHKNYLYQLQVYSFWFENGIQALEKRIISVRGRGVNG
jgi:hypothetical protein